MNEPIRILNLEDARADRDFIAAALDLAGLTCEITYSETEDEFRRALEQQPFDIILSDFTLPSFSGAEALEIARSLRPGIPFLLVSGTIGEERAVELLREGATDYVRKDHLVRLGPAVRRALREARESAERRRAEEQLLLFRSLIDHANDAIEVVDPESGRIIDVNERACHVRGYTRAEMMQMTVFDLLPDTTHCNETTCRNFVSEVARSGSRIIESHHRRKDGSIFPVEISLNYIQLDRGYLVAVVRDITERRRAEEELRVSEERLRQSQKMEAIGQLAGGIAHDFNNMLGVILLHCSLLLDAPESGLQEKASLQDIMAAAERAAHLTRQLLTFSRREMKQARVIDLGEVIDAMVKLLRRVLGENIAIETRFSSALPPVHADPGMIEQIIMNLAINARDAMPDGGRLSVTLEPIANGDSRATAPPGMAPGPFACLSVSDTGHGIAPENLSRIFEPFFTTKEVGKGTGLGLATVFGIVEQHRGWIEVESEVNRGTTFRVFLPAAERESAAAAVEPVQTQPPGGSETVLLVEDEVFLRTVSRIVLEQHGYRVFAASDPGAALQIWEEERHAIHLLLTDLVMPGGLSGRELAERLIMDRPDLKIIYTSGYSEDTVSRHLHLDPGRRFLQKPCSSTTLLATVRRCLDE